MNLTPESNPSPSQYDLSTDSLGRAPYEVVQAGFSAYWSSCGFVAARSVNGEAELLSAVRSSINNLPIDPVLQPELSIERVYISDRRQHPDGRAVVLMEFLNAEAGSVLWYAGKIARLDAGSGKLAVVLEPGSDSYRMFPQLDTLCFRADLERLKDFQPEAGAVEMPVCAQVAENLLRQESAGRDFQIRKVFQNGEGFRFVTSEGSRDVHFVCNALSRLVTCSLSPCLR